MLKILNELYKSEKVASFYTNRMEINSFHFGLVLAVNEYEIALQLITPDGEYDGITVMDTEKIFRVETDGQYAKKMCKLCDKNALIPVCKIDDDDILKSVLMLSAETKEIVSCELLNSGYNDVVGFVLSVDDDECKIQIIDDYGFDDGVAHIPIDNITQIAYATQSEQRIKRLYNKI